MLLTI
ncbi:hypothetical protein LINPERHAP1_LOCUS9932 [Linum perenne]|jgi:predicted  nucleic acid-binding Zn-ribbon protein